MVYNFVKEDFNKAFGSKKEAKAIISSKMEEVQEELYRRIYGRNPYRSVEMFTVTSTVAPEDLIKSFQQEAKQSEKPFVVDTTVPVTLETTTGQVDFIKWFNKIQSFLSVK